MYGADPEAPLEYRTIARTNDQRLLALYGIVAEFDKVVMIHGLGVSPLENMREPLQQQQTQALEAALSTIGRQFSSSPSFLSYVRPDISTRIFARELA